MVQADQDAKIAEDFAAECLVLASFHDDLCDKIEARNQGYVSAYPDFKLLTTPQQAEYNEELGIHVVPALRQCQGLTRFGVHKPCRQNLDGLTMRNVLLTKTGREKVLRLIPSCFLCTAINNLLNSQNRFDRGMAREAQGLCIARSACSAPLVPGEKHCEEHQRQYETS